MAHISSIGASMFSDLSVANLAGAVPGSYDATGFNAMFVTEVLPSDLTSAAGEFMRVKNVREFPAIGTPPNVVNVPVYGAKTSQQVQGQADAPSMEITLNFVAADWASSTQLGTMVGDGKQYVFRFTLMNSQPPGYASSASGLGGNSVQNSIYYFIGKIDSLLVTPQLNDATTATIAITLQSQVYGAYTV